MTDNGEKAPLPFAPAEYESRLAGLRAIMAEAGLDACVLTSMHNVAYYSGFLYCSFGRFYALVVTAADSVTIGAGIDAGQPWRRCHGEALTYTDWRARQFLARGRIGHRLGQGSRLRGRSSDLRADGEARRLPRARAPRRHRPGDDGQRMVKSPAEIELIRAGAAVADIGGYAIRDAIRVGAREIDVAMAGRDAMELEIAKRFPDAEYRDSWVWFQSGLNTDGAHNPVTARALEHGDILSAQHLPDDLGLLHRAGADAVRRRGRPRQPADLGGQCCGARAGDVADPPRRRPAPRSPRASTNSSRSAICCNTALSATATASASSRTTMAARPGWSCARTSTPCSNPAWSSRWSRC
jgi:hypothetical protein